MIVAVVGTGTEVGKTHVACALVGAIVDHGVRAIAWKPVESGVEGARGSDEAALAAACGRAADAPTLRLCAPLSPHLAARREGVALDAAAIRRDLTRLAAQWSLVVLELAGGLCSPFDDTHDNVDFLAAVPGVRCVLVAPDRLGVLHDVSAALRAAHALDVRDVVLGAPAVSDASTTTNAAELRARRGGVVVHEVPRAGVDTLRAHGSIAALARRIIDG